MISVTNLAKLYKIYPRRSDRLREWLTLGKGNYHKDFWALRDVNLKVPPGTIHGIVGMNGAGKSTLLKIIAGITTPTSGTCLVDGRVAALLELGTGFHPELSGVENVRVNARLHGLTDEQIEARLPEIEEFAELGVFFRQPVRTYSSGMYVRLAFALATATDPQVLIVDEALSVGDAYFQQKCLKRIRSFQENGVTILFVSHDLGAVKLLCNEVTLLKNGASIAEGKPVEVLELYNDLLAETSRAADEQARPVSGSRSSGNQRAQIVAVRLENAKGERAGAVVAGEKVKIVLEIVFHDHIKSPTVGVMIRDRLGYDIFGINSAELKIDFGALTPGERLSIAFDQELHLGPGEYTITAAIHADHTHVEESYHWVDRILSFKVLPPTGPRFLGAVYLRPSLNWDRL